MSIYLRLYRANKPCHQDQDFKVDSDPGWIWDRFWLSWPLFGFLFFSWCIGTINWFTMFNQDRKQKEEWKYHSLSGLWPRSQKKPNAQRERVTIWSGKKPKFVPGFEPGPLGQKCNCSTACATTRALPYFCYRQGACVQLYLAHDWFLCYLGLF